MKYLPFLFTLSLSMPAAAQRVSDPRLHVLGNGLRVITVEDHTSPLVTVVWTAHVGESSEPPAFQGNSHFLEHLILQRGTEKFKPDEISKWIIDHGGYVNGFTWLDYTGFETMLSSALLDRQLDFAEQTMFHATFHGREFEQEKSAVQEEFRRRRDLPLIYLIDTAAYRVYPKETFYSRSAIGTIESVQNAAEATVRKYYQTYYVPNNMTLVLVGDFDTDRLLRDVERRFGRYPRGADPKPAYEPLEMEPGIRVYEEERAAAKSYFLLLFPAPTFLSPEYLPLELLAAYLSEGNTSVLRDELITKKKLLDDVDVDAEKLRFPGGYQWIDGEAAPENVAAGVEGIFSVLSRVWSGDIDLDRLEGARRRLINEHATALENQDAVAQGLAKDDTIGSYLPFAEYDERLSKVTPLDVLVAARKYFRSDQFMLQLVDPKGKADPALKARIAEIGKKFPMPEQTGVKATTLANGSVVWHEPRVGSTIESFTVAVRAGSRFDGERPGLAKSALVMMTRRTAKRDRFALRSYLDENGFVLSSSIEKDAAFLTLQAPAGKTRKAIELLREIVTQPAFPADDWDATRKELAAEARELADSGDWVAMKDAFERMFPGEPYAHPADGSPESIAKIGADDLRRFAAARYAAGDMALAYVGPEPSRTIEEEWAKLKPGAPRGESKSSVPATLKADDVHQVPLAGKLQSYLRLMWPAPKAGTPEWVRLELAQQAFGFSSGSRLWQLRQKEQLAYVIGSDDEGLVDQSVAEIQMGTATEKREKALAALRREIDDFAAKGMTQEELDRVKVGLTGFIARFDRTAARRSDRLAHWWVLGLPPTYRSDFERMVHEATLADVNKTIATVFDPAHYVIVDVGPYKTQ